LVNSVCVYFQPLEDDLARDHNDNESLIDTRQFEKKWE